MSYDNLAELEKRHVWHPFTQMQEWEREEPLFIERAVGVRLIAADGRAYYDANSSMWLNVHGHRNPAIDRAIVEQLGRMAHSTMLGLTHEPATRLAVRLSEIAPPGLQRVFYSDDGSTAVEVALKMAYQYWRQRSQPRRRFVTHAEGYHGDTIGAVSVGGVERFHSLFRELQFEADMIPSPARARDADEAAARLEAAMAAHPGETAAVIVEPLVQMAGGVLISPPGYLRRLRDICDRWDALLIFDEVATGFGRTGKMFACEHEEVSPDFLCVGKGLTGGYLPLAATLTTERIYEAFLGAPREWKQFTHGHSYTGNPLACAAALANLDIFETEDVLAQLPERIATVARRLQPLGRLPGVRDVRHCGLMVGIELVEQPDSVDIASIGVRVCRRARQLGLITRPLGSIITFVPPLCSTEFDLVEMIGILQRAIEIETA
ncbi:MAG: adenosylmethionine--8-amino-7-oxononanoate transaminase [Capsulimonadaceae bacterium]